MKNKNKALISVVISIHNEEKHIGRCLRSLLSQNFSKELFQIVVVNDGSTDKTSYALGLFSEDIIVINNQKNLGLPASLNKAINCINTKYFVRVDGDDYVGNNFLLFLYSFIVNNKHMDAIACDYNLINKKEEVLKRKNCMKDPIACGIMFQTHQIVKIGLYDENFLLHEERDLRIRFLKEYSIHRLELPLYRYRQHDNNITNNKKAMEHHMSHLISKHNLG
jgi:glycosyltransferase involved in cell wall biosynthesis